VQVYPAHYPSAPGLAPTATLALLDEGTFGRVITLPYAASDVSVRVWVEDASGREALSQIFLRLPWQPDEKGAAGPDIPGFSAGDARVLGGGDARVLGGGDARVLGGGDARVLGGGDARVLGGGDARVLGGGDARVLGGGDARVLGGGDARVLGGGDARVLGGGDARVLGGGDARVLGGGDARVLGGADHPAIGNAPQREFAAPILSSDAQVVVYDQAGLFEPSGILALQVLPTPPELGDEPWLVPVGQAYAIDPDPEIDSARTIAFNYLQRDVPEGYEHTLAIYYLARGAESWQRLETRQFVENLVVADLQPGAGTYAVMSTIPLPSFQPGWNLFAYPLPDSRSLDAALASIVGRYSVVHAPPAQAQGLVALLPGTTVAPDAAAAAWLATLRTNVQELVFGAVYLIRIEGDEPVTLYLAPPRRSPDGAVPGSD
ncbi:MAG TPA: hypothetical protein VLC95_10150, partial [Anaerolineae bacterium]|nr:hypothetical protein [Anaerolineae bacterium]